MDLVPEYKTRLVREMRQRQTESEALLWERLRGRQVGGLKFRRQHPLGRFIVDFYCSDARLVVEIDGSYHDAPQQQEFDREREAHFTGRNLTILRFSVDAVLNKTENVLQQITEKAHFPGEAADAPALRHSLAASELPLTRDEVAMEGEGARG
ncbi:MAG: endonuclease domain-containing protein [Cytophagales bacterium]|nr:endonuclease domain-containing protein [Armatimonadota bacterium]